MFRLWSTCQQKVAYVPSSFHQLALSNVNIFQCLLYKLKPFQQLKAKIKSVYETQMHPHPPPPPPPQKKKNSGH